MVHMEDVNSKFAFIISFIYGRSIGVVLTALLEYFRYTLVGFLLLQAQEATLPINPWLQILTVFLVPAFVDFISLVLALFKTCTCTIHLWVLS